MFVVLIIICVLLKYVDSLVELLDILVEIIIHCMVQFSLIKLFVTLIPKSKLFCKSFHVYLFPNIQYCKFPVECRANELHI